MLVGMIGAPGAGKTTLALGVTYQLKKRGLPAVYLEEYATRRIIMNNLDEVSEHDQAIITTGQFRLEHRYNTKENIVICDSSLWLCKYYLQQTDAPDLNIKGGLWYDVLLFVQPLDNTVRRAPGRLAKHVDSLTRSKIEDGLELMVKEHDLDVITCCKEDVEQIAELVVERWMV